MGETARRIRPDGAGELTFQRPAPISEHDADAAYAKLRKMNLSGEFNDLSQDINVFINDSDIDLVTNTRSDAILSVNIPKDVSQALSPFSETNNNLSDKLREKYESFENPAEQKAFMDMVHKGEIKAGVELKFIFEHSSNHNTIQMSDPRIGREAITGLVDQKATTEIAQGANISTFIPTLK